MTLSMTWEQVRARRLARAHLLAPAKGRALVDVVSDVCGVQAQVMRAAEIAIAVRVADVTQEDVHRELWEKRTLVKTWSLRGTLHLHTAKDLPIWLGMRRGLAGYPEGDWYANETGDRRRSEQLLDAIGKALRGRTLLREELADAVCRQVGEWPREQLSSGWAYGLDPAVYTGRLCQGPPQGAKVTFARTDEWVRSWHEVDADKALREAVRRYLRAYGPATHARFAEWIASRSLRATAARELFESLGDELEPVDVDGKRHWLLRGDEEPAETAPPLCLLPEYDALVLGFREREHLLGDDARARLRDHGKGRLEGPAAVPWLLVDGRVAGWWSRKQRGPALELRVEPFRALKRAQRAALEERAERLAAFFGLRLRLDVAPSAKRAASPPSSRSGASGSTDLAGD
ncbi:MAG TPA: winged helix DNA-binding domain-containing protein [Gaiellaceae bacterium]